ncbi:MAG: insulinase family protein, partial [Thermodesulfobacteriota bacterium]|nr:insulinase family protein [Thermodesulfobacteriota bacterium]
MIRKFMPFLGALVLMAAMLDVSPVQGSEPGLTVLSNGLQVLIQPDTRFPLVSLRLYVRAGSAYETKDMSGISHFLEHMVFKGTAKRPPGKVAEDIESAGGYLNASTSFDYTVYVVDLPLEHWTLGLDVIRDMIFNAALDPEELEREKEVVLAELERGEDSPTSRLFKSTQALVWPDTAYGRPIIGYRETVRPFTREHILNYIAEFYQPQSMLLVVCGDVDPAEAVAQAGKYFGELENTRTLHPPRALTAPVQGMGPKVRVEHGPWNKAYLSLAFPLPGLHSEESAGLEVLGYLLGGDETSRLYRKFKYELELVDDISVYALSLEGAGMLYVHASLDRDKVDEFWQALNRELASLDAHDFTAKELDRTKLNIEDSLFQAKETLSGLAGKIGYFQFFERGREAEENYLYALSLVDKDQLQALIQKYLRLDSLCASLLLPEDPKDEASEDLNEKFLLKEVGEIWPAGSAGTKASADAKDSVKGPEIQDLGLGRTLVLLPDETLPYVSLNLVYGGGDSLLKPDEQGLAEMTAGALTKGTKDKSATQIQDFLSDRASFLSASAHRDLFTVSSKFPIRFEDDMLGLIQETLNSPAFAKQEVDRVRRDQTSDIKRSEDRPLGLAFRNLFPFLFQKSGYGYFHLGTPKDLERYDEGLGLLPLPEFANNPFVIA